MNLRKWTAFGLLAAALFFWQAGCHLLNRFPQEQAVSIKLEKGLPAASYEEMIRTESQAGLAVPFVHSWKPSPFSHFPAGKPKQQLFQHVEIYSCFFLFLWL